jgi:hypothetical protein
LDGGVLGHFAGLHGAGTAGPPLRRRYWVLHWQLFLTQKRQVLDYQSMGSPLGHRKAVNNENVRAVFGDKPPLQTLDLHEDELTDIVRANEVKQLVALPGLMLLKLFVFTKKSRV